MARPLNDVLSTLPSERQATIERRANELRAEVEERSEPRAMGEQPREQFAENPGNKRRSKDDPR